VHDAFDVLPSDAPDVGEIVFSDPLVLLAHVRPSHSTVFELSNCPVAESVALHAAFAED